MVCAPRALLSEPSAGEKAVLTRTHMDAKIIKVQVRSRSCKISDSWMFLGQWI